MAEAESAPVKIEVEPAKLQVLGTELMAKFTTYCSDRQAAEAKWIRNLRQYIGVYDPDIEKMIAPNRSRAYPRITRVKCISVLSRIMNLMFPGNERNWELKASPSADMAPEDVQAAIKKAQEEHQGQPLTQEIVDEAVQTLADERAETLAACIDDQLQELGGTQQSDYIALNRKVADSGIKYGLGVLRGPFVREYQTTQWAVVDGQVQMNKITRYKPQFEFTSVWDYYPDMLSKSLYNQDGYFLRLVMTKAQLRKLKQREDYYEKFIEAAIKDNPTGNYTPKNFETQLRSMGTKANVNDQHTTTSGRFEIVVWHGPVSLKKLSVAGIEGGREGDTDVEAEVWMVGDKVIKADISPWYKMGVDMTTSHIFTFDDDDTSPIGNGLPNVTRDSQMSIAASARMLLDNASVVCGPNLEVNVDLLLPDQDRKSVEAYKVWEREGDGVDAQFPAVRNIEIDGHLGELQSVIKLFMEFADIETFVGPATGGDMERGPSEPMRTAAGASMIRGDAALPFKDIIRNFDVFTQSVINAMVHFNKRFNPDKAPPGDINVIARGATSLIAKEVRGMQVDQLATTLTDEERMHVDERKFVEARFKVRDLDGLLVSDAEAKRRRDAQTEKVEKAEQQQAETLAAEVRKTLSDAFKNIAQGQKNSANADATAVDSALKILEKGLDDEFGNGSEPQPAAGVAPGLATQ